MTKWLALIPTPLRMGGTVALALALVLYWYIVASDYSYEAVSGTYLFHGDGESSTLVLWQDQSFDQDLTRNGKTVHVRGTWRRLGEGGVVLSNDFLKVKGQKIRSDGQADGEIEKRFAGFFPSIRFEPQFSGPKFNRNSFDESSRKERESVFSSWLDSHFRAPGVSPPTLR